MPVSIIWTFKVIFLVSIHLKRCSTQSGNTNQFLISNIIEKIVKPYLGSIRMEPISSQRKSTAPSPTNVKKAIEDKIKELKSYFDDTVVTASDKLESDDEETTIVEFVPSFKSPRVMKTRNTDSEPFNKHIQKYQKMRDKIKVALEKEAVSKKTKKMVIKTIDDVIAQLVSSQCEWNTKQKQILREAAGGCQYNNITLTKDECRNIVLQYFAAVKTNKTDADPKFDFSEDFHTTANELKTFFKDLWQNQSLSFLNKFTDTVSDVMNDAQSLSEKYKVKCSLVEIARDGRKFSKSRSNTRRGCEDFKICTDEFREYLTDFYERLNDTTVSVFRNYAAMYIRDVNSDASDEKSSVVTTINDLSSIVERRVSEAFTKHTSKIKLHQFKDKETNIKAIKNYLSDTVKHVKRHVNKNLEEDLSKFKARLLLAIKEDIVINLDVDLGNLERNFLGRVCSFFVTCNGEAARSLRKRFDYTSGLDPHSVYVKVELTLDNQLKEPIERSNKFSNAAFRNTDGKYDDSTQKVMITRTSLATTKATFQGSPDKMKIYLNIKND